MLKPAPLKSRLLSFEPMKHRSSWIFYGSWLLLAFIQAGFTELLDDEAYYWMYSRYPAFGYFDHPPVIAWIVGAGYWLFQSELGVRLIGILLWTLSIYLVERVVEPRSRPSYYLIVLSIAIIHFMGFLALPDSPLVFFTSLFILGYKRFLDDDTWQNAVWIGISAGLMILSKYHGALVILFILFSNLRLLRSVRFWAAGLLALIILMPHLLWQIDNGFETLRYHFIDRNTLSWSFSMTLEYLMVQPFILGPVAGIFFFIAASKKQTGNFYRSMQWTFWGVYIFFFLMSLRGRVEGHWTMISWIPGLIIAYKWLEERSRWMNILLRIAPYTILFILFVRACLMFSILPSDGSFKMILNRIQGNEEVMHNLSETADGKPVYFMNSYQKASLYAFYTGEESWSSNNRMGRKNQFDIWNEHEMINSDTVLLVFNYKVEGLETVKLASGEHSYIIIPEFRGDPKSVFKPLHTSNEIETGNQDSLVIIVSDPGKLHGEGVDEFEQVLGYQIFKKGKLILNKNTEIEIAGLEKGDTISIPVNVDLEVGNYQISISSNPGWLPPYINSRLYSVEVVDHRKP